MAVRSGYEAKRSSSASERDRLSVFGQSRRTTAATARRPPRQQTEGRRLPAPTPSISSKWVLPAAQRQLRALPAIRSMLTHGLTHGPGEPETAVGRGGGKRCSEHPTRHRAAEPHSEARRERAVHCGSATAPRVT